MRAIAKWTHLALIALSSCALAAGEMAKADAPASGAIPPGWVWQGVWQDGRWNGQWVPGPGFGPGFGPGSPAPGVNPGPAPWGGDPEAMRMADRCREHRDRHAHDHDCEGFFRDHGDLAPGYRVAPPPYGPAPMAYPPMAYAPMAYMMVPVITVAQPPSVETRTTVTTTYVREKCRHVVWTKRVVQPHRKEKRVYTGS